MSLINEALKKAQRVRTGDPAGTLPPMPGGSPLANRSSQSRSARSLLFLAAGGVALVILSVAITFWLVNRAPVEKIPVRPVASKSPAVPAPAPKVVAPVIELPNFVADARPANSEPAGRVKEAQLVTPPAVTAPLQTATIAPPPATPPPAPVAATAETPPTVAPPATSLPTSVLTSALPSSAAVTAPPASPKADERVHVFVDSIHVTGIRSSGGDSRVLMNDRVFRVNDIVERSLGVRLTKVESDTLTFTDVNGVIYVKHF